MTQRTCLAETAFAERSQSTHIPAPELAASAYSTTNALNHTPSSLAPSSTNSPHCIREMTTKRVNNAKEIAVGVAASAHNSSTNGSSEATSEWQATRETRDGTMAAKREKKARIAQGRGRQSIKASVASFRESSGKRKGGKRTQHALYTKESMLAEPQLSASSRLPCRGGLVFQMQNNGFASLTRTTDSDMLGLASSHQALKPSPWLDKPSQAKWLASRGLGLGLEVSEAKAQGLSPGLRIYKDAPFVAVILKSLMED
ncbi:hypothetical protein C8R45DRAFT_930552 [Mycena sanguinolenta]|nr:hypothetical protein C8R45DRAFT_930552 [Mycena sanguinolenta]